MSQTPFSSLPESLAREIKEQFPYVGLEQLTLIPDRRNPALIDARLRLVAIEFNR